MISRLWLFLWLPAAVLAEGFTYTGTVFFNQMKVYSYNSTADVKTLTFILRGYSGNPDLYIDTPIGTRFASWYSRKTSGNDWIVIQSSDRQLTDNKGMNRTFSFGVYGASRDKARFQLTLSVERKAKRTAERQAGEQGGKGDMEESVALWPFGAVIGATFGAIYCFARKYSKAEHYMPLA